MTKTTIFLFRDATEIYHFKATNNEIKRYSLYLANISKAFSIKNMEKN